MNFQSCKRLVLALSLLVAFSWLQPAWSPAAEKWPGVDESVVEKYAREHGREAREPLINTGQGDLLLFVFLIAGTVGGFAAGYYWRMLTTEKRPAGEKGEHSTRD